MSQSAPTISVIIPTLRNDRALQALLNQLRRFDIFEIIIVQAGLNPLHYPRVSTSEYWLNAPRGRGSQIQCGLKAAKGDILWIVHADSIIPDEAVSDIHHIMAQRQISLGCFPLRFNAAHAGLSLFEWLSRPATAWTTFGDQGYFFRRKYLAALPDLSHFPLLEDVALYRVLSRLGRVKKSRFAITTNADRFLRLGIWRTQWRNMKILWQFYRGVSPARLYALYYNETSVPNPIRSATSLSGL